MSVIVAPWSNPNSIKGRVTALGVEFGVPAVEREGVPKRRMAWAHPFNPGDLAWVREHLPASVQVLDGLPDDWRWPEIV